jgi:hypothetical protein
MKQNFEENKREYLKEKTSKLETNSKNKNITGLYGGISVTYQERR